MKLLEYEAKELLRAYGLPVPRGQQVESANTVLNLPFPVVLKVQIPKGGRGKAGGIKIVANQAEYEPTAKELLAKPILGCDVRSLLAEEKLEIGRELYLAITIDRTTGLITLLAHKRGGMEVESLSNDDDPLLRIPLSGSPGGAVSKQLSRYFDLQKLQVMLSHLYEVFIKEDALLVEINPLVVLTDGGLMCADAKIELDDAASFRHAGREYEMAISSQFIELSATGTVASMANGAGLAMATVDAIKAAGAEPANFYDVGGGTDVEGMVRAFQKIAAMPEVAAIVVNIFGGITRCDEVARAIIEAQKVCKYLPQLYIRLTGTNETEGQRLLEAAGITFYPTLADCVQQAVASIRKAS